MDALKRSLQTRLATRARAVLERYHPTVVAVTGSVGKTSTKEAIATVLKALGDVRASSGNYNNELGVPLTIIGVASPGRSLLGWWRVMASARHLARGGSTYPKTLVLEMGADRPGDLAALVAFAKPSVSVVTDVSESHLEYFSSIDAIAKEKSTIVQALGEGGLAVLNADNHWTAAMRKLHTGQTLTYGITQTADVRAEQITPTNQLPATALQPDAVALQATGVPLGTTFRISYKGQTVPVWLPRVLGMQQVYAALAAAAVGVSQGCNLVQIGEALLGYVPPRGRMNLVTGVKHTLLIDDTYNASTVSAIAALEVLGGLKPRGRRIAVLGDMAELGRASEAGHREVGRHAAHTCDFAVFVGPKMKLAAEAAEAAGLLDEQHTEVLDSRQVEAVLQPVIQSGDIVLIKGSQSARMERVTKALMAEPERAAQLLVRQYGDWLQTAQT